MSLTTFTVWVVLILAYISRGRHLVNSLCPIWKGSGKVARPHYQSWLLQAMSSSDLKQNGANSEQSNNKKNSKEKQSASRPSKSKRKTFHIDSVVHRLKQASLRAAAHVQAEKEQSQRKLRRPSVMDTLLLERDFTMKDGTTDDNIDTETETESDTVSASLDSPQPKIASLQELTKTIDEQLKNRRQAGSPLVSSSARHGTSPENWTGLDSMTAVTVHNARLGQQLQSSSSSLVVQINGASTYCGPSISLTEKYVAVVLSKPLQNDQITVEFATRIQRLVQALRDGHSYQPQVIVFVGDRHGTSPIADCDAGYTYFRHLMAAQNITLPLDSHVHLERSSVQEGALYKVSQYIQHRYLSTWRDEAESNAPRRRAKLLISFTLFSSEYHLCILHDIHMRSPASSPLSALERWSLETLEDNDSSRTHTTNSTTRNHTAVETSWTYQCAKSIRTRRYSQDPTVALASANYLRAQSLIPVLENLRGVVANREFFQRDNYRTLVHVRRNLVSDMEDWYQHQPSLLAHIQQHDKYSQRQQPKLRLDVVLESALLSLGRCLDLVRPAGLLTGIVPSHDFQRAVQLLEQTVSQITVLCDPDQPLPPSDWGVLDWTDATEE